ncbi:hypothetical protein [uncultured Zobellia sp.]|uniref:hypothetical protein n=1 Tax=uncultured Zobellia sp. TaxID=255433 RepID=UPI002597631C|nr:hypothetical protein [uncultured Zobellia sp.]
MNTKLTDFIEDNLSNIIQKNSEDELYDILDNRDEDDFSDKWMEIYEDLKEKCKNSKSEKLREIAFKKVNEFSKISDLSSYISDDFGLFSDAIQIDYQNEWLNGLWLKYKQMEIPNKDVEEINGRLEDIL